ncbi:hypothetical protein M758_1G248200 [Ceratodon purpureus]|nr:hypothetical protein M758_1G248200 [Ceratodon purpureus]
MEGLNSDDDEEWLRSTPSSEVKGEEESAKKRQRKVITLDDILEADHKESIRKLKPRKSAKLLQKLRAKSHLYASSSDDDDDGEVYRKPTELLEELEKQVTTVAEEVELEWGLAVFGLAPAELPSLARGGAPSVQRALSASKEAGRETSLEELARSGFLRAWAFCRKRCDESTLRWAYHQMAYSSDEALERACCKFLCDLVCRISSDSETGFTMEWLPSLVDFKQTLGVYGYREHGTDAENMETPGESIGRRLAKNLRSVFEFIATCFARRSTMQPYYSTEDISSLLCMMAHLSLERGLLEILDKIQDCILVLLRYFTPDEWPVECPGLAHSIFMFTDKAHNGFHVLKVISGLGNRSVDLQRHLALLQLTKLSRRRNTLTNSRDVTSLFSNAQLKGKFVDFKRFYYQMVIADTFLWCNEEFASDRIARYGWLKFLGSCSVIFIGDERPFATKLRNQASFLVTRYSESELEGLEREGSPERFDEED